MNIVKLLQKEIFIMIVKMEQQKLLVKYIK